MEPSTPLARAAAAWISAAREGMDSVSTEVEAIAGHLDNADAYTAAQATIDVSGLATRSMVSAANLLATTLDVMAEISEPLMVAFEVDFVLDAAPSLARVELQGDIAGLSGPIPASKVSFRPKVLAPGGTDVTMVIAPPPAPDFYTATIVLTDGGVEVAAHTRDFFFP